MLVPAQQGSIVAVASMYGEPVAINSYDEYGIPGAANKGRFGYTGQTWIPELGMWYYKARIYSPTLGRFLQVDPIGYDDQVNLYAYVGNDPVNALDPSGLAEEREFKVRIVATEVRVSYGNSGGSIKVESPGFKGRVSIAGDGASAAAKVGSISGQATVGGRGASASVAGAGANARATVSGQGASAAARAGRVAISASVRGNGASVAGRLGDRTALLEARTVQAEKAPSEYSGRHRAEDARTGKPTPRTTGQRVMEGIRTALRMVSPWVE